MAISGLLNTAKDALLSHQLAIDVTGSNIANVNTPGYARQRAVFQSLGTIDVRGQVFQIGVDVTGVERIYDGYLEAQIIGQHQLVGYHETRASFLANVETIFDESGSGGLADLLNRFWGDWQDLSANPDGQVQRAALLSTAQSLAAMFRNMSSGLKTLIGNAEQEISSTVTKINSIVSAIGDLNRRVVEAGGVEGDANLMLDNRTELLKSLAGLVDISIVESGDGSVKVFLSDGSLLVDGVMTKSLALAPSGQDPTLSDIVFTDKTDEPVTGAATKGKLGALIEVRDRDIPRYLAELDALAAGIVNEVNTIHRAGFDRYRNTGIDFFTPVTQAAYMQVSAEVSGDVNRMAASATVMGDGENALALAGLGEKGVLSGGMATFGEYYTSIVGRVGQDVSDVNWSVTHQNNVMERLTNMRESVSGVSVDEEMIRLIQYQLGYNAAGKLCSVVDEMLQTLMGIIR
ncbi:MAG: flagellar hook-associated protein FlgK [Deltaproteobacteria bacterium]|jgi:flagellar hook-associated protein 1 FlgK|nr:flagellar hook-associated protein FlgK [Deltaproteobacteria bacterium]